MVIQSLELANYRNYNILSVHLDESTNIFYGQNAQGKTNILESIYVGSTTKSHRTSKDKELLRFGQEEAHIKMIIKKKEVPYRIDMHLKKNRSKGIAVNGIPIRKVSEMFGIVNVIFFSPEDLNIIKSGPGERRKFIDMELCQLDKVYVHDLLNYNKVLRHRNKLLKDLYVKPELLDTLDVWDLQLAEYGYKVSKRREEFISQVNETILPIHKNLSSQREELKLVYEPCSVSSQEEFLLELKRNRERDCRLKSTSAGPHRDDVRFEIGELDVRCFGSQGQQRTCALSLKLAEIELVKKLINDTPILLLDDVLSELDSSRQNHLLNEIGNIQTLITCTGLDEFVQNRFQINKVFQVEDGRIYPRQESSK